MRWHLYASADVFVLPSYSENFGLVIAEALACGVPVVTTDATPWKELNARGCGWCIPVGVEELEKCLRGVFKMSREELAAKGAGGVDWMRESFSWQGVGSGWYVATRRW